MPGRCLIRSNDFVRSQALINSASQSIDLPDEVLLLREEIDLFKQASSHDKRQCAWHLRCLGSTSYERFRQQQIFPAGQFDLSFSQMAENAYSALFNLCIHELPHCTPTRVIEVKQLAGELLKSLPTPQLLPGHARNPSFLKALTDLCSWRPSDLPVGISARGNQVRRWMIRKIAEEFMYTFAQKPPVGVVGDLIRFGWPRVADRSIRRTMTEDMLTEVAEAVSTRRKDDN